ncbi:MAG: alanine/glycine:cation symporter family protein [Myxococcota bacterium]
MSCFAARRPRRRPSRLPWIVAALSSVLLPALAAAQDAPAPEAEPSGLDVALAGFDAWFGEWVVGPLASVFFLDLAPFTDAISVPFIVVWLVVGAVFFTFRYGFPNLRAFGHAIDVVRGKYDDEHHEGEVSHFQALSSALSATVGLGNIAGVAIAVTKGGPGAVFWMVVAGFFGMVSKFSECTLGQLYREVDANGKVSGGPFRYLRVGLEEVGVGPLGRVLSVVFAFMCIGGSFGGGNMFQANQSYEQLKGVIPALDGSVGALVYGLVLAFLVGAVILGGIKRIGQVAGIIVPVMCAVYVLAGLYILLANAGDIPMAFGRIIGEAFSTDAVAGGAFGVLLIGFQRAAFSNEAGVGSASIAHSAASTDEPVREGIVALLEPFIDTIIVCTMTGLVIVITGMDTPPVEGMDGVALTSAAFDSVLGGFQYILTFAVVMFAFSTMVSWSYYGERSWTFLFGNRFSTAYKILFLVFVVLGCVLKLGSVIDFSDLMILGMAFPNILGMYFLAGKVKRAFDEYWKKLQSGAFEPKVDATPAE